MRRPSANWRRRSSFSRCTASAGNTTKVERWFVAHTVDAWEFPEEQFFQVSGDGGTYASSAFRLARRYWNALRPGQYNAYLFYASDGENASADREAAADALRELARRSTTPATSKRDSDRRATRRRTCADCSPSCRMAARGSAATCSPTWTTSGRRSASSSRPGGGGGMTADARPSTPRAWKRWRALGLDYPVDFELAPERFMIEIAVYGLPVRMPHWSFGVRYIHQLVAQHGALEDLRGDVPGRSVPRVSGGRQFACRKRAGDRARAGTRRFRQEQRAFRAFDGDDRRQHRRACGGARAPDRDGARPARASRGSRRYWMRRSRSKRTSTSTANCIVRRLSGAPRRIRPVRATTRSGAAGGRCPAKGTGSDAEATRTRCRRIPNTICSGSSRTMARNWRTGSATYSSRCARSRSISIRCSPARS